jgi:hypothetical protein
MYFCKKLSENANNPKKTWKTLREIISGDSESICVDKIAVDNVTIQDPILIADEFNSFFTKVGQKISDSVIPTAQNPEDSVTYNREIPPLDLGTIVPQHVIDILKSMDPKISVDLDGISMKILKYLKIQIATPLAHIFNLSLQNGVFPSKLKCSRTVPIFKSGDSLSCDNYRPIALQSSIAKILEKIVSISLINHLELNHLLYEHQYGFQRNKSTEQNLMQLVNFVSTALNEGKFCIGIFLDLKKAFDVVSHEILLKKLAKMDVSGTALKWFRSYLSGRSQKVDINGNLSSLLEITISVLQGSILGPILFLCFINDLWTATTLFSILFADDTSGLASNANLPELINYANVELKKIANWFRMNKMAINTSKTKFCRGCKPPYWPRENLPVVLQ